MQTLELTLADAQQAVTLAGAQQAATLADAQLAGAQRTHGANHAIPVTPAFLALVNYQILGLRVDDADTWSVSTTVGSGLEAPSEIPSLEGAVSDRLHDATVDTREDTWHSELIIQTDHSVPFIFQTLPDRCDVM